MTVPVHSGEGEGEGEGDPYDLTLTLNRNANPNPYFFVEHVEYPECQLRTPITKLSLSSLQRTQTHVHSCKHTHTYIPDDALNPAVLLVQVDHLGVRLPGSAEDTHVLLLGDPGNHVAQKLPVGAQCLS